jgi:uncharacterized protein YmfQ (DUF2313 family)
VAIGAPAYARQLKGLLPPGAALLIRDSTIEDTLEAIAEELARLDARGEALIEEADPRTTAELITDWERVLGLPDGCVLELPATLADRRLAVAGKIAARGGQSRPFFIAAALALGFTSTISEFYSDVLRSGFRSGDRVNGIAWVHTWRLDTINALLLGMSFESTPVEGNATLFSTVGGTLGTTQHNYRVSAINANGETLANARRSHTPASGATNQIELTWASLFGATGYRIYAHRSGGAERFVVQVGATNFWVDDGSLTIWGSPFGALPSVNTAWVAPLPARVLSFECIMTRAAPGHSITLFAYSNPT